MQKFWKTFQVKPKNKTNADVKASLLFFSGNALCPEDPILWETQKDQIQTPFPDL